MKRAAYKSNSRRGVRPAFLAEQRREGWTGKTYRSALKFSQRLDREAREAARARVA
jgi:hypothetical protein